jgi:hypothetical protein
MWMYHHHVEPRFALGRGTTSPDQHHQLGELKERKVHAVHARSLQQHPRLVVNCPSIFRTSPRKTSSSHHLIPSDLPHDTSQLFPTPSNFNNRAVRRTGHSFQDAPQSRTTKVPDRPQSNPSVANNPSLVGPPILPDTPSPSRSCAVSRDGNPSAVETVPTRPDPTPARPRA